MIRIDQVLPSLASRDAIGIHTQNLKVALEARGIETRIFYGQSTPDMAPLGESVISLTAPVENRIVLYHASIGSPVFETLMAIDDPIVVDYHNITPARLFERWEPAVSHEVALGRRQMVELAPRCVLGLADSAYNERELIDWGYRTTSVAPLLIDMRHSGDQIDEAYLAELLAAKAARGGPSFLYVGKISPHKAPHGLVAMVAAYRELYDPRATLTIVGSPLGDRYIVALRSYIDELGLNDAVIITGSLTGPQLDAEWEAADVFVSASDHEGFCVPLVEAMGHRLPVVANGVAAIPETLGNAGLAIPDKSPIPFATAVHRVVTDQALRTQLIDAGIARLDDFDLGVATERFMDTLLGGLEAKGLL